MFFSYKIEGEGGRGQEVPHSKVSGAGLRDKELRSLFLGCKLRVEKPLHMRPARAEAGAPLGDEEGRAVRELLALGAIRRVALEAPVPSAKRVYLTQCINEMISLKSIPTKPSTSSVLFLIIELS